MLVSISLTICCLLVDFVSFLQVYVSAPVVIERHLVVLHNLADVLLVAVLQPVLRREAKRLLADVCASHRHDCPDGLLLGGQFAADWQSGAAGSRLCRHFSGGEMVSLQKSLSAISVLVSGGQNGEVFWISKSV